MTDVMKRGGYEDKGEMARMQYFVGGITIGELIRSTLGPYGMNKILQPMTMENSSVGETTMTNDGATILKSVYIDNPAAKILNNVALRQDNQFGDGTTSVVVLAAELLRQAEMLLNDKIHPQLIVSGYQQAAVLAQEKLTTMAFGEAEDSESFKTILYKVAKTTLSSKLGDEERELFSNMAVDAILRIQNKPYDIDLIEVLKKPGGLLKDSFLDEGFILDKKLTNWPDSETKTIENCNVLIANTSMDNDKIKIYGAKVSVDSFNDISEIEAAEKEKMKLKVDNIVKQGCNIFVNRQLIYPYPTSLLKEQKVLAIEHSDFDNMERLAQCLDGEISSTFDVPTQCKLGFCKRISEKMIGEDRVIHFSGCRKNEACTIVLRGSNMQLLAEAERSLHDAISILSQTLINRRIIYGAGCSELGMAVHIQKHAATVENGKQYKIFRAYAEALKKVPTYIIENAGLDASDIIKQIENHHAKDDKSTFGIDLENESYGDVKKTWHLRILRQ